MSDIPAGYNYVSADMLRNVWIVRDDITGRSYEIAPYSVPTRTHRHYNIASISDVKRAIYEAKRTNAR